jgi:hypothetical protein
MRHVIVTRFSVPRLDAASASRHAEPSWLDERLALFRTYYVPSVARLGVPVVLLCSSASAPYVTARLGAPAWASVEVQDSWYGGWSGSPDQVTTRLDSDDALHQDWFRRLDAAIAESGPRAERAGGAAEAFCTKQFMRLDMHTGRLYAMTRRWPSPLAAFTGGANPYAHDHEAIEAHYRTRCLAGTHLLQIAHGGNLSNRAPGWWRFYRRVPRRRLAAFGIAAAGTDRQAPAPKRPDPV